MSDWYYAVDNVQKGPISEAELKAQLATQKPGTDPLVWKEGMDNWTPASQVAALLLREPPAIPGATAKLSPDPSSVARTPGAHNPESARPITIASLTAPGEALEVDEEDAENNKIFGVLSYLSILCLVPLFAAKESPFAKYHANQGLVLFVVEIAVWIVLLILDKLVISLGLSFIPWFLSLIWLAVIALVIIGIINAAAGKCVPLPLVGKYKLIR